MPLPQLSRSRSPAPRLRSLIVLVGVRLAAQVAAADIIGPADLALTFRSPFDGSEQPYRLFLPSAYNTQPSVPLLLALHGTDGDQNKYFEYPEYGSGLYKREAEKRGIAILCPLGNDALHLPTEWRGLGELNALAALEDACRRFHLDRERVVCTGQSMGGTGTTYLCCRYPDLFAGGIPLASTYGHVSLVTNLRYVPMFYVQGERDWPGYARTGPIPLTQALQKLGYDATLWMVPDSEHNTMKWSTGRVLDWVLEKHLIRFPRRVTFRAYFPIHGRAYWTEIQKIARIGGYAEIDVRIEPENRIVGTITNAKQVALRPEPELVDLNRDLTVVINGETVFAGRCQPNQEIRLVFGDKSCLASIEPRHVRSRTAYPTEPIGTVGPEVPTWEGEAETTMGNWIADAMRDTAGTDVAICSRGYFRGITPKPGQTIDLIDLINWIRPMDSALATFKLTGADLREIIEDNIRPNDRKVLLQVSGCRYTFDRGRPQGRRISSTDIVAARTYSVVCDLNSLTRGDTMRLAGRFDQIPFERLDYTTISSVWRFIDKTGGHITSKLEGRVRAEETP